MTEHPPIDKRKNKNFLINNGSLLKQYALRNYEIFGRGIIVINLLLLDAESLNELEESELESMEGQEPTVHQPISYIPKTNFWFKMISLKIKKKHQIDLETDNSDGKFSVVFIKDASIEYFSIYSLKVEQSRNTLSN